MAAKKLTVGSLFAGIGGFDLGFERAGFRTAWQVEIDRQCRAVLAANFPKAKRYEDVKEVSSTELGPVDVICGGFPCQDLSVAGRRAGLSGERSGLWYEFYRILSELKPRLAIIENVPGLLSGCGCVGCCAVRTVLRAHRLWRARQFAEHGLDPGPCAVCHEAERMLRAHSGRNFAVIVSALVELGYCVSSRVLDAQYFGVPQRRDRVIIVASLGGAGSLQVLFEPGSVSGNPAPSRAAGQAVAGAVTRSSGKRGGADEGDRGTLIPEVAGALGSGQRGWHTDTERTTFIPEVAHPLRSCGADASEDGTGRGTPIILDARGNGDGQTCPTITGDHANRVTDYTPIIAMQDGAMLASKKQNGTGISEDEVMFTLDGRSAHAIAFDPTQMTHPENRSKPTPGDPSPTLAKDGHPVCVAFPWNKPSPESFYVGEQAPALQNNHCSQPAVLNGAQVRRLTPRECMRLQGFPTRPQYERDWIEGASDSAMYAMIGNAVAVPVAESIGIDAMRVLKG